ncbi:tetratricopeptide repeat protein [Sphingomonas sp.]|uniref:tetratricopeptide repeat protein n=1 Tax=Sphingomonas sp. TaxID=28214 RepID=UPI0017B023BD|nr:tetratricopeptide repeat protein [Sphingomonas sp.]MBA4761114.1 tetratricopeptide repeat protein [Sphingomonas sp.]
MHLLRRLLLFLTLTLASPALAGVSALPTTARAPRCIELAGGDAARARYIAARRAELAACDPAKPTLECAASWGELLVAARDPGDLAVAERYAPLFHTDRRPMARTPQLVRTYLHLAGAMEQQACFTEGEPLYRLALALVDANKPDPGDVADIYYALAWNLSYQERHKEAEATMRATLALWSRILPAGSRDILQAQQDIAYMLEDQGRFAEAEKLYAPLLAAREKLADDRGMLDLAVTYTNLGYNLASQGRLAEGEALFRKGLDAAAARVGDSDPMIAKGRSYVAAIIAKQGRTDEAESWYRRALAVLIRRPAMDPDRARAILGLATHLQRHGRAPQEVRSLLRVAADDARLRQQLHTGFSRDAQAALQRSAPIFAAQVRAAWDLAQATPGS